MSRTVNAALRAAALAAQTGESCLVFLDIAYGATTLHVVNNLVNVDIGATTYTAFPFAITLPSDKDGNIGDATLTIDATDLSIVTAVRTMTDRATVHILVALASAPSTTELDLGTFEWKDITYTKTTVSGTLSYADKLDVLIPGLTFSPANVPGNF